jgi:acetyl esterase/lipase
MRKKQRNRGYTMPLTHKMFAFAAAALAAFSCSGTLTAAEATPAAPANAVDSLSYVDPELRETLEALVKQYPAFEVSEKNLEFLRKMSGAPPLESPAFVERMIPGPSGAPDVRIYIIGAREGVAPRPAVLHIHGGGYVHGTAKRGMRALQQLATAHDCVVVTVDYRLAPETRFPGSLEDSYAALRWMHSQADELGIDRTRIALLGESAGGGLVAALAIAARDRGEVPIALQVMIYPALDDRTGSTRPVPAHIGAFVWNAASNRFGWSSLLGVPAGSDSVPRGAVPARVANLTGLPPAFIATGSIDLFVQEDIAYAQRLIEAGVTTELYVAPGGFHAFDTMVPNATISKRFTAAWNDALARKFKETASPKSDSEN